MATIMNSIEDGAALSFNYREVTRQKYCYIHALLHFPGIAVEICAASAPSMPFPLQIFCGLALIRPLTTVLLPDSLILIETQTIILYHAHTVLLQLFTFR